MSITTKENARHPDLNPSRHTLSRQQMAYSYEQTTRQLKRVAAVESKKVPPDA